MRQFILRARKGPSSPGFALDNLPGLGHLEIVAHCISNALFYSGHIRPGVVIHVVLDGPSSPPKTVRFESDRLGSLAGFDERSICMALDQALACGRRLATGEEARAAEGIFVSKLGFEPLVRQQSSAGALYYLRPKGGDIRQVDLALPATFVFSDHLGMPKKADRYLERLGAIPLSVGPKMLFASQCIVLAHNELDRRE